MAGKPTELLERMGAAVKARRKAARLTRRDLAARTGLSERFLSEVEAGRANPSLLSVAAIGQALGVAADELLRAPPLGEGRPSLALLGLRGAGKSTVGRLLAERLGWPFVELDQEIETHAGLTLAEIFSVHGEEYYRRAERAVLERLFADGQPRVLATGGGIVSVPDTFAYLCRHARTIWLRARPEDHWKRVLQQGDLRPMQGNERAFQDLCAILEERERLYRQAERVVDTSGRTPAAIANEIARQIERPKNTDPIPL